MDMEIFRQLLIIAAIAYGAMLLFLFFMQKKFIFFPTQARHNIEGADMTPYSLEKKGVILSGWLLNADYASQRLLIYYGGNAEDVFLSRDQFRNLVDTAVLLVNYRGYGTSTGDPGEKELFADALGIYDDLSRHYSPDRIFLMGRSLGSGVANYVAAHRTIAGIILITPFDSLERLAKRQYPIMPVSLLLRHKFRSIDYVKKYSAPAAIIYGGRDNIVPPKATERLIMHMGSEKKVVFIKEAEHNNIELFDEFQLALLQFIDKYGNGK